MAGFGARSSGLGRRVVWRSKAEIVSGLPWRDRRGKGTDGGINPINFLLRSNSSATMCMFNAQRGAAQDEMTFCRHRRYQS